MALSDTLSQLNNLVSKVISDITKVYKGNKSAAQRVRVGTIDLEKVAKKFRKESLAAEKTGRFKQKMAKKIKKKIKPRSISCKV